LEFVVTWRLGARKKYEEIPMPPTPAPYETYRGLPPLAGLATMADAMKPGLSVDQCVQRLKRYHYALKRLHEIFTARLTAEPIYELKTAFSLHAHLCAEHCTAVRTRIAEMREPPLGLDVTPDTNLEVFFDEILSAPDTERLVSSLYLKALSAVRDALERHLRDTNPLVDHPSVRVCRFAMLEVNDMIDFGQKAVKCLVDETTMQQIARWLQTLDDALASAGSLDGTQPSSGTPAARVYSTKPFVYDPKPRRDERFIDPYNRGVNPEAFLYDEKFPNNAKVLMMLFKRIRELDVPEMMAGIIAETKGKPWGYYKDMSRQLWDEARHTMMGEVGFTSLGIDWRTIPITWTWSLNLNTQLTAMERHAVLFFIEQGLMPRTGKRFEWEVGMASGDPLAGLFQDYDWADEVLHAAIGRQWYVKDFANPKEATAYGDRCWSKIASDYRELKEKGLTEHRNWWPEVYRAACKHWGIEPDAKVLAYNTTYESTRADLKELPVSG
jgi:hypothetical protein